MVSLLKKPMTGESDSGHSSQGSSIVWFHEKDLILQHIHLNDRCLFFLSVTLFRVDIKRLNKFCILTRRIKITNMQFLHFFYKLAYIIIIFFFSATHYYVDNKM